jgi:GNAT superfamily N-acetyltransferase
VPVFHLARLAVDRHAQGIGLGKTLLMHALHNAARLSLGLGIYAVEVYAVDDTARDFHLKYGFVSLVDDPRHLYLSMKVLRRVFPPNGE